MSEPANGTVAWRLQQLEREVDKLDAEKAEARDVARLADEVAGLRKAVVGFSVTIGASAIVFAFGIVATLSGG